MASLHVVMIGRLARRAQGVMRPVFVLVGLGGCVISVEQHRRARAAGNSLPERVRAELGARPSALIKGVVPRSRRTPMFLLHRSNTSASTRGVRYDGHRCFNTLDTPLLVLSKFERDGYLPNVVYSCGALRHQHPLLFPSGIAMANLDHLVDRLLSK